MDSKKRTYSRSDDMRTVEKKTDQGNGASRKGLTLQIPSFITQKPWYIEDNAEENKQETEDPDKTDSSFVQGYSRRSQTSGPAAKKYRKGACDNCGSLTHRKKDCTDRPRKKGAKWSNSNIMPDEFIQNTEMSFDGKRDRWSGFRPADYDSVIERFEDKEHLMPLVTQKEHSLEMHGNTNETSTLHSDMKTSISVGNLRIREDTAKYLRDLHSDPSTYDPKTRSIRKTGVAHSSAFSVCTSSFFSSNGLETVDAGDEFVRSSTENNVSPKKSDSFAWENRKALIDSKVNFLNESVSNTPGKEKDVSALNSKNKEEIESKYGVSEDQELPNLLLLSQDQSYSELSRNGDVLEPNLSDVPSSRYKENGIQLIYLYFIF